ncbi:MAG: endonuclease/exonuclease/phosphatase family protein [Pseudobdellovibrionaceae bacterium]
MKALILLFGLYWISSAIAAPPYDPTQFRIVPDADVIEQLNSSAKMPLKMDVNVLVWNVKKATGKESWRKDLNALARDKSFVLLQEGLQDDYMPKALSTVPGFGWTMAKGYYMEMDHNATGVINGSIQDPNSSYFLRSPDLEPVINMPKMIILTTHVLEDNSQIMIANIHGINFQTPEPFYRQIDQLIAFLSNWKGKIVLAGDFNTWIPVRTQYLIDKAASIGLEHIKFAKDPRPVHKVLDHIFIRGCKVVDAKLHMNIKSSDHPPLTADLACAN